MKLNFDIKWNEEGEKYKSITFVTFKTHKTKTDKKRQDSKEQDQDILMKLHAPFLGWKLLL